MGRRTFRLFVIGVALLACSSLASADSVTISNCSGCFGGTYTLTVNPVGSSTTNFTVTLTIDARNVVGGQNGLNSNATHIGAVSFKVSNTVITFNLTSAPGGTGLWLTSQNGINNAGCANSGSGMICSMDPAPISAAIIGQSTSVYTWTWNITVPSGSIFAGLGGAHIGAQYDNPSGTLNGQIVSLTAPQIPEPGTLVLFGTGLFGVAAAVRRRMKR